MEGVFQNLTNQRFGRLTVEKRVSNIKGKVVYQCLCDCGNRKSIRADSLAYKRINNTRSCGCLQKEKAAENGKSGKLSNFGKMRNQLFSNYKRRAKYDMLEFNLTFEYFDNLITQPCYYCGEFNKNTIKDRRNGEVFTYNGIDRLNSKLGYISSNTVACCGTHNYMKLDHNEEDFLNEIKKIYEFRRLNVGF